MTGHKKQLEFLNKSLQKSLLTQAYLFYGPSKIGKFKVAKEFAKKILSYKNSNKKEIFKKIDKGAHPDFRVISPDKNDSIKIGQTRDLVSDLNNSPFSANKRVAIINQADKMTKSASNSILKFLEEPPFYAYIILTADNKDLLLPTIISRCQILRFSPPSKQEIIKALNKFSFDKQKIQDILFLAGNKMELALSLAQDKKLFNQRKKKALECKKLLIKDELYEKEEVLFNVEDLETFMFLLLSILRFLILAPNLNASTSLGLKSILKKYNKEKLINISKRVLKTDYFLKSYVNRKIALEYLIIGL